MCNSFKSPFNSQLLILLFLLLCASEADRFNREIYGLETPRAGHADPGAGFAPEVSRVARAQRK